MDALLVARREAAVVLGVCLRTVDYLIARGELPVRRVGRRVLVPRSELEKFVRRGKTTKKGALQDGTTSQ